jgi:hypothetical protein
MSRVMKAKGFGVNKGSLRDWLVWKGLLVYRACIIYAWSLYS